MLTHAKIKEATYQTILAKANSGQQLTRAELEILKEKNLAAYAKVTKAEAATQTEKPQNQTSQAPGKGYDVLA
jgi:hypothetical protein